MLEMNICKTHAKNFCDSLEYFYKAIMEIYRDEFLRRPTHTDVEKLYPYREGEYFLDLVNLSRIYAI